MRQQQRRLTENRQKEMSRWPSAVHSTVRDIAVQLRAGSKSGQIVAADDTDSLLKKKRNHLTVERKKPKRNFKTVTEILEDEIVRLDGIMYLVQTQCRSCNQIKFWTPVNQSKNSNSN